MAAIGILLLALLFLPPAESRAQDSGSGEGSISDELSTTINEYLEAQEKLTSLKEEQKSLKEELKDSEKLQKELKKELAEFAGIALTQSDTYSVSAMLATGETSDMLEAMTMLDFLGESRARRVEELVARVQEIESVQDELDANIDEQDRLTAELDEKRRAAAREMAGSSGDNATGPAPGDFRAPIPVSRNPDGSLPYESCSETDPTTTGCLSPRALHGLEESKLSGFTRFTRCYRYEPGSDHSTGQACDYSVSSGGFGGVAGGQNKTYGDNLAAWFVQYAEELGVKYVIWYKQFWSPATGWTAYLHGGGDPNSDHTNHVHVSWR
ncbi:coiled-coil domain-containing protein [Salininema proteolyticum]|uniref:Coiled-coil domain-containing protein n=1 Tax=Salininema proteolyticum TaxID=1607685 RepID=A0ABV8TUG4_9ACTN